LTALYPRTSDHACFNMAPPDRNGLRASFILRATDTDVFVFLKKRKTADSPSFWLSNSTRPVAVQDDGQYGTWLYAQSYADLIFVPSNQQHCMCCTVPVVTALLLTGPGHQRINLESFTALSPCHQSGGHQVILQDPRKFLPPLVCRPICDRMGIGAQLR
jgi:hypothetical protein